MLDSAQIVLLFVVVTLTVLLVVLGVQVFFILRDVRETIAKANKVLDDTSMITESLSGPITTLSTIAGGIKTGATFAKFLQSNKRALQNFVGNTENE